MCSNHENIEVEYQIYDTMKAGNVYGFFQTSGQVGHYSFQYVKTVKSNNLVYALSWIKV